MTINGAADLDWAVILYGHRIISTAPLAPRVIRESLP